MFVEFLVIFSVISDFLDKLHDLFDQVFLDNFKNLVLLQKFSGNVKREILGIYNTFNKTEEVRDKFLAVIHNEDSSNIEFDVIFFLLGFEQIEGSSFGNEENAFEF